MKKTANCHEVERMLEDLVAGRLEAPERQACERHLAHCDGCAQLAELATVTAPAAEPGESVVAGVLRRTTGAVCARAESLLCDLVDDTLGDEERSLVTLHLEHCTACRALARALDSLANDLPVMVELPPEAGFVARVMAASLPFEVRFRRRWESFWSGWVRRPRFAIEMAYVLTLFFAVLFALPGAPLAAMPRQALDLARASSLEALEEPVRQRIDSWSESPGARAIEERWEAIAELKDEAPDFFEHSRERVRTFFASLALLWENANEDSSSGQAESTEETS